MKRLITTFALAVSLCVPMNAYYEPGIDFGIKAGLNFSVLDIAELVDSSEDYGLGFSVGAGSKFHLNQYMALAVDYVFSQKNYKLGLGASEVTGRLGYLEVPVRLQFDFNPQFGVFVGGDFSYLVTAETETAGSSQDAKDVFEDFNYGANLGVAFRYDRFEMTMGYSLGLSDVYKGLLNGEEADGKLKTFFVNGSYMF